MLIARGAAGDSVSGDSSDASACQIFLVFFVFFLVLNSGCATYQEADKTGSEAHQWALGPAERKKEGDSATFTAST